MSVNLLSCRVCGGKLDISEGNKVAVCQYCGQTITIPTLNERLIQQLNRGSYLRHKNEFDNALRVYQQISAEYPDESEAYWGIVLSRYGITYVDDGSGKKPTLHRMQYQSILKDDDYIRTLKCADEKSKRVYQENAELIDIIQKKYHSIVNLEKPYDVFICYKDKEINAPDKPTMDRVYAQEIYSALTEKGYKVFFSHITLEKLLGYEYEPYIFAALHSASVMLVVGTRKENLESVWVRNEWSRFLEITQINTDKKLIPVFRDMDAYDLPKEFLSMSIQGIDYGKLGALQLIVNKVSSIMNTPSDMKKQIEKMMLIAGSDMKNGLYDDARNQYEQIIRIDNKNFEASMQLLLIDCRLSEEKELLFYNEKFIEESEYWAIVTSRANSEQRQQLERYRKSNEEAVISRFKKEKLEYLREWIAGLTTAIPIYSVQYKPQIDMLLQILDFQDANELLEVAIQIILKSLNVSHNLKFSLSWRGYKNEDFRENCKLRKKYFAELHNYLQSHIQSLDSLNGIRIIENGIQECISREEKIDRWLIIGKKLMKRVTLKKYLLLSLTCIAIIFSFIFRSDPVVLMICMPAALFFLLSLHQVEATVGHILIRIFLCLPMIFFAWRISLAHSLFSRIFRLAIWGGAEYLIIEYCVGWLFDREMDDIDRYFKS